MNMLLGGKGVWQEPQCVFQKTRHFLPDMLFQIDVRRSTASVCSLQANLHKNLSLALAAQVGEQQLTACPRCLLFGPPGLAL